MSVATKAISSNALLRGRGVWVPAFAGTTGMSASGSPLLQLILFQDRHLELERAVLVLVIDEQHADEFLADIDLRGVVLFRPRHDTDFRIAEHALEIGVELSDFLNVHGSLQSDQGFPGGFYDVMT